MMSGDETSNDFIYGFDNTEASVISHCRVIFFAESCDKLQQKDAGIATSNVDGCLIHDGVLNSGVPSHHWLLRPQPEI